MLYPMPSVLPATDAPVPARRPCPLLAVAREVIPVPLRCNSQGHDCTRIVSWHGTPRQDCYTRAPMRCQGLPAAPGPSLELAINLDQSATSLGGCEGRGASPGTVASTKFGTRAAIAPAKGHCLCPPPKGVQTPKNSTCP